jgi:hypothetical protein
MAIAFNVRKSDKRQKALARGVLIAWWGTRGARIRVQVKLREDASVL